MACHRRDLTPVTPTSAFAFNPDGSEGRHVPMAFAVPRLLFATASGQRTAPAANAQRHQAIPFAERSGNGSFSFVWLGQPRFDPSIPMTTDRPLIRSSTIGSRWMAQIWKLRPAMGNHCCIFVDDFKASIEATRSIIEVHPQFPERTNVIFTCRDRANIRSGSGSAASGNRGSGTCSCAAVVASVINESAIAELTYTPRRSFPSNGGTTGNSAHWNGRRVYSGERYGLTYPSQFQKVPCLRVHSPRSSRRRSAC